MLLGLVFHTVDLLSLLHNIKERIVEVDISSYLSLPFINFQLQNPQNYPFYISMLYRLLNPNNPQFLSRKSSGATASILKMKAFHLVVSPASAYKLQMPWFTI
jgi:hypothetical protein